MVLCLAKRGEDIINEMSVEDAHLLHMAVGISGEAGELLDAIKKRAIYQKELDRENIIEELGDLEFYIQGIRMQLRISREECLEHNLQKLARRYIDFNYTNQAAIDRADKA